MVLRLHAPERIGLVFTATRGQRRKQAGPPRADLLSAIVIPDRVLHNALEQHRQFLDRLVAVLFGELQHAILNDVQCSLLVANREHRLLERAPLYPGKKVRQFCAGCQMRLLNVLGFCLRRPTSGSRMLQASDLGLRNTPTDGPNFMFATVSTDVTKIAATHAVIEVKYLTNQVLTITL